MVQFLNKELAVADKEEKVKKPNAIQNFYKETVGELRKVNWPTTKDALHLTKIVLIVLALMSAVLGLLDIVFSNIVQLIVA